MVENSQKNHKGDPYQKYRKKAADCKIASHFFTPY